jgi:spermidine/putrescine transport system permease protein
MQVAWPAKLTWGAFIISSFVFLLTPLVLVIAFSFGDNEHATLPIGGLTTRWYAVLFENHEFWRALHNSIVVTAAVGLISTVVGTVAALGIVQWNARAARAALSALAFPIMLPPLVLALALATFYSSLGARFGLTTVITSHLVFTQPFVILIIYSRLATFDFAVVDAGRDLGASMARIFFSIILPVIRPTVIGAALIAMAVSLDDFVITFFTIGGGLTLPTLVWGMMRTSLDPSINALGSLILLATVSASILALMLTRYRG